MAPPHEPGDKIYALLELGDSWKYGVFREWLLITGRRGGLQKRRGWGQVILRFYPYKKRGGGGRKSFSYAEGGYNKFWGSFNTGA